MKKVVFLFLSCLMALSMQAKSLTGKWSFEAPTAPTGFQNGTVEFKQVNEKTCAFIDFGFQTFEVDVNETAENKFSTQVPVMGSEIDVTLDNTEGKMKTTVNAIGMVIDVKLAELKNE